MNKLSIIIIPFSWSIPWFNRSSRVSLRRKEHAWEQVSMLSLLSSWNTVNIHVAAVCYRHMLLHTFFGLYTIWLCIAQCCVNLDFFVISFCWFIFFMWHSEWSLCCAISFPRASMKLDTLGHVLLESTVSAATVLGWYGWCFWTEHFFDGFRLKRVIPGNGRYASYNHAT